MASLRFVHIAAAITGGAGIGLSRFHRALLEAGEMSQLLVGFGGQYEGVVDKVGRKSRSRLVRAIERTGLRITERSRFQCKVAACGDSGTLSPYELYSFPCSDFCAEKHRWMRDADVVNLHWVAGILDWPRFFSRVHKPFVWTLHDQNPYLGGFHYELDRENCPELALLEREVCDVKRKALRSVGLTAVGNSKWTTERAQASDVFPAQTRYETIYYPIDCQHFAPRDKAASKAAFGVDADRLVLGFACENLNNRRKGFGTLLAGIERMPENIKQSLTLLSFGRPPSAEVAAKVAVPWVHLGSLEQPAVQSAAYSAMDVFVIPSLAEAFGQTALEALACETPVVGSRVGGIPEVVMDGVTGGTFAAGQPDDLAARAVQLLEDADLRKRLGRAGRKLAEKRHRPEAIARQLISVYQRAAAR